MRLSLTQRAIIAVLVLAAAGAALAVHRNFTHDLRAHRAARLTTARQHVSDALQRRAYYLEDVADMVGVHDDAAAEEFSRYAHVRGREEASIVSVQWVRHAPRGTLVAADPADGD